MTSSAILAWLVQCGYRLASHDVTAFFPAPRMAFIDGMRGTLISEVTHRGQRELPIISTSSSSVRSNDDFVAVALNMAYCIDDGEFQEFASQQAQNLLGINIAGASKEQQVKADFPPWSASASAVLAGRAPVAHPEP